MGASPATPAIPLKAPTAPAAAVGRTPSASPAASDAQPLRSPGARPPGGLDKLVAAASTCSASSTACLRSERAAAPWTAGVLPAMWTSPSCCPVWRPPRSSRRWRRRSRGSSAPELAGPQPRPGRDRRGGAGRHPPQPHGRVGSVRGHRLVAGGAAGGLVGLTLQDARLHQPVPSVRQHVGGGPERSLDLAVRAAHDASGEATGRCGVGGQQAPSSSASNSWY